MSMADRMQLALWTPAGRLFEGEAARLVAVGPEGSFGILPNHVDLAAALVPSVLLAVEPGGRERVFGVDEGLLVKRGHAVEIAVRRAVESPDLASLQDRVAAFYAEVEDEERVARSALSRMEAGMVRRFAGLRDGVRP
jgi:F-type H+-transporting ATPase subunit epsilon